MHAAPGDVHPCLSLALPTPGRQTGSVREPPIGSNRGERRDGSLHETCYGRKPGPVGAIDGMAVGAEGYGRALSP